MTANWLAFVVIGLVIMVFSLVPLIPAAWKPFIQGLGGLLIAVGVLLLVLGLLGVAV